jgi:6-phosphogluconate dehydrogenase
VKAGPPVDYVIDDLAPLLDEGDIIIDGGNSLFTDTTRRYETLAEKGIRFVGMGVSGGEEGARHGPSIMPGGDPSAWPVVEDMLKGIAAKADDGAPCCEWIGEGGAGHYVKMVHNGIEYGDMQVIAEAYDLMRRGLGMSLEEIADVFASWNEGYLRSYLIEITADILRRTDPETGDPVVEVILDRAGQKGTGGWAVIAAVELGAPAPTIAEAVAARSLSAQKDQRVAAAGRLRGPERQGGQRLALEALRDALLAAKICAYAQGFAVMAAAGHEHGWPLELGTIASIWRGGCIIRARFLGRIREAYGRDADLPNLMLDRYFAGLLERGQAALREVTALAARQGVPAPGFASALAYYDGYRAARGPANLIQAQRDYFGAHTYERVDRSGSFHADWPSLPRA